MDYNITIYINDPHNDYYNLTQRFKSKDITLSYDHDHHEQLYGVVFTKHIESLKSEDDIAKRLFSLQILLTGARFVELAHETHRRIAFDGFQIEDHNSLPNGFHKVYADSIEEYPFKGSEEENSKNPDFHLPCDLDSMLFSLSKVDYVIRSLLFQAGMIRTYQSFEKISTWNSLYKILDTVNYGCKKSNINIDDLIDSSDLNRFTSACNNALVLGVNARHGLNPKNKMPKKEPITHIDEAVNLILCLAKKFVIEYINRMSYCKVSGSSKNKCQHHAITKEDYKDIDYSKFKDLFMSTFIRLTDYKNNDEKEQGFFKLTAIPLVASL